MDEITSHARRAYPEECCGMVLRRQGPREHWTRVMPFKNHEAEPCKAYRIDPFELLGFQKKVRSCGEEIGVIYHSHPDAPAWFSAKDEAVACPKGRPANPERAHLVLSVVNGEVAGQELYRWDPLRRKYEA